MKALALLFGGVLFGPLWAQERAFTLTVPDEIAQTGVLQHILPRFSLKHGIAVTQVPAGGDAVIGTEGEPAFTGLGELWHIAISDAQGAVIFREWLLSDIGQRTIIGFQPEGAAIFAPPISPETATVEVVFEGDPLIGETISLARCGRCHVVNEKNRMAGMGQAPSFAGLRRITDWQRRFTEFYLLNPHPSFTQVPQITSPFPANLPPAIVPIEVTQTEIAAILAYVATLSPADLGAEVQNQ